MGAVGVAWVAAAPGARETAVMNCETPTFDAVVVPHLDAGLRLARTMMRNEHDAEDAVQEASLRAFRYFRTFTGGSGRAWFLSIVRNSCHGWHGSHLAQATDPFEEQRHSTTHSDVDPEMLMLQTDNAVL